MKKYLFKIIPIFLAIVIFPMASGLCFQNFFDSMLEIKGAVAATIEYRTSDTQISELDVCDNETNNFQAAADFDYQAPVTDSHNTLLPCCFDGEHPGLAILSQSLTFDKVTVLATLVFEQKFSQNLKIVSYHNPIIAPPELSMVKATTLRL